MTLFTARPPLEAYGLASTVSEFCDSKSGLTDARATIVAFLSRAGNHDIGRIACQTAPGAPRPPARTIYIRPAALTGPGPDATFLPTLRPLSRPGRAPRAVRVPEGGGTPMDTSANSGLMRRLERLERSNRRLKIFAAAVLVGLAAIGVMGQARPPAQIVEAQEFIVRDTNGTVRARLGAYTAGAERPPLP